MIQYVHAIHTMSDTTHIIDQSARFQNFLEQIFIDLDLFDNILLNIHALCNISEPIKA